jgi:hypothetical protein
MLMLHASRLGLADWFACYLYGLEHFGIQDFTHYGSASISEREKARHGPWRENMNRDPHVIRPNPSAEED